MTTEDRVRAMGATMRRVVRDGCTRLPDGSYGPIVQTITIELVLRDLASGNTVVRTISNDTDDSAIMQMVEEMRVEMRRRARETRRAISAERRPT